MDTREKLLCQNIGDEDLLTENVLCEDNPEGERADGATEEKQLESQAIDISSVSRATGPPSPLIPTDVSPQTLVEEASKDDDEIPYPYPNPDLPKGKHHGSMRPPTVSEELWKIATKEE